MLLLVGEKRGAQVKQVIVCGRGRSSGRGWCAWLAERELRGREQFSSDGVLAFLASSQNVGGSTARFHSGNYRNSVPLRNSTPEGTPLFLLND